MEHNKLHDSAYDKVQKLYNTIFDSDGNMKSEYILSYSEVQELASKSIDEQIDSFILYKELVNFTVNNKCNILLEQISIIASEIERINFYKYHYKGDNTPIFYDGFTRLMDNNEKIYYEILMGGSSVFLKLYNLDDSIEECRIYFKKGFNNNQEIKYLSFLKNKELIELRPEESSNMNVLYSKEIINTLLLGKERLSNVLNRLRQEYGSNIEESTNYRKNK